MKLMKNQQAYLKGLLFIALVANISWEPAMRSLNTLGLASEVGGAAGDGQAKDAVPVAPQPAPPKADAAKARGGGVEPAPAARAANAPPAPPAAPPKVDQIFDYEVLSNTCQGRELKLQYIETKDREDQPHLELFVYNRIRNGNETALLTFQMPHETIKGVKDGTESSRKAMIEKIQKDLGVRCRVPTQAPPPPAVAQAPAPAKPSEEAIPVKKREERNRERLEKLDSGRICLKDEHGDKITNNEEKIDCLMGKLEDLDLEDDKGKAIPKKDLMAKMERIVRGNLKDMLIEQLVSDDEDEVKEGGKLLASVIKTVKAQSKYLKLDATRTNKLVSELLALGVGSQTNKIAKAMMTKDNDLQERLNLAMTNFQNNPNQWTKNQVSALQVMRMSLAGQIGQSLVPLYNYRQLGLLGNDDYRAFLSPYGDLSQDMLQMGGLNKLGLGPELGLRGPVRSDSIAGLDNFPLPDQEIFNFRGRGSNQSTMPASARIRSGNSGYMSPRTPPSINFGRYGLSTISLNNTTSATSRFRTQQDTAWGTNQLGRTVGRTALQQRTTRAIPQVRR